ncbi:MAG: hypothetical protein NT027_13485 [Proteobacteria bacterium]|nr:hypothetical protein [Pseudomonadota bacterium]
MKVPKFLSVFAKLRNSFLAVIILIQLLLITLSTLFGKMTIKVLEEDEAESIQNVVQFITSTLAAGADVSKIAALSAMHNSDITKAFEKQDRPALLKASLPLFADIQKQGFKQFQFHIPKGYSYVTFLRVHHPDNFGEDLAYRPMIFKANTSKELVAGLEQGKSGYGFRVVAPVESNGKHLGSLEMGFDFGETFLKQMNKDYPGGWAIYNLTRGVQAVDDRMLVATLGEDRDGPFKNLPIPESILKTLNMGETFTERSETTNTTTLYMPVRNYRGDIALVLKYVFHTEFFNRINRVVKTAAIICIFGLILSGLVIYILNQLISSPMRKLVLETEKIRNFNLDDKIDFSSSLTEINELIESTQSMKAGLQSFKKYVPAQLVRQLIESKVEASVGGQRRNITIFFSDVIDFTTISESLTPNELTQQLSEYLSIVTDTILKYQGTVDKYIGDCVVAFWGAPVELKNHAELACRAVLECQKRCNELNARWKSEGKVTFETRIGINSGETIVGNMGSSQRLSYTIIGDEVNLASRLEGLNKAYNTRCIISENTVKVLPPDFALRLLDFVIVKGKTKPVLIYELIAEKGDIKAVDLEYLSQFNEAIDFYLRREWKEAIYIFENLLKRRPTDKAASVMLKRCEDFSKNPPPDRWRGEFAYHEK